MGIMGAVAGLGGADSSEIGRAALPPPGRKEGSRGECRPGGHPPNGGWPECSLCQSTFRTLGGAKRAAAQRSPASTPDGGVSDKTPTHGGGLALRAVALTPPSAGHPRAERASFPPCSFSRSTRSARTSIHTRRHTRDSPIPRRIEHMFSPFTAPVRSHAIVLRSCDPLRSGTAQVIPIRSNRIGSSTA